MNCSHCLSIFILSSIVLSRATEANAQEGLERKEAPPATAASPAAPAFGRAGSVVLDEVLGFGVSGIGTPAGATPLVTGWIRYEDAKSESNGMTARVSTIAFAPSLDVFVAPRLSLGGQLTAFHTQSRSQGSSTVLGGGLRPRIGWVAPITEDLAFWPRAFAAISYSHATSDRLYPPGLGGITTQDSKQSHGAVAWAVGLDAIMAASISRTVVLTFGPTLSYGKLDASGTSSLAASRTSISAAVHGGIALAF